MIMSRIFSSAGPGPQLTWTAENRKRLRCRERLGGLLKYYEGEAA